MVRDWWFLNVSARLNHMRLHRFYSETFIEPQSVGATSLYGGVDQWRKVFRFTIGDKVILFDGSGFDFVCEIAGYQRETAEVKVVEVRENHVVAKRETTLCAAARASLSLTSSVPKHGPMPLSALRWLMR